MIKNLILFGGGAFGTTVMIVIVLWNQYQRVFTGLIVIPLWGAFGLGVFFTAILIRILSYRLNKGKGDGLNSELIETLANWIIKLLKPYTSFTSSTIGITIVGSRNDIVEFATSPLNNNIKYILFIDKEIEQQVGQR